MYSKKEKKNEKKKKPLFFPKIEWPKYFSKKSLSNLREFSQFKKIFFSCAFISSISIEFNQYLYVNYFIKQPYLQGS